MTRPISSDNRKERILEKIILKRRMQFAISHNAFAAQTIFNEYFFTFLLGYKLGVKEIDWSILLHHDEKGAGYFNKRKVQGIKLFCQFDECSGKPKY